MLYTYKIPTLCTPHCHLLNVAQAVTYLASSESQLDCERKTPIPAESGGLEDGRMQYPEWTCRWKAKNQHKDTCTVWIFEMMCLTKIEHETEVWAETGRFSWLIVKLRLNLRHVNIYFADYPWLTLCEAIDRFRSIPTWVHSNLIFW